MARGRKRLVAGWGLIGIGVVVASVMVASRWYGMVGFGRPNWIIDVARGQVCLHCYRTNRDDSGIRCLFDRNDPPELNWKVREGGGGPWEHVCDLGILSVGRWPISGPLFAWSFIIMLWPIAFASFAGGVPLVLSARKVKRRAKEGQCPACGYALAGLAAGAACPECGKAR